MGPMPGLRMRWRSLIKKGERIICHVSFSNFDLANLVNGWLDDPVELHPFDCHFTKEGIIRLWIAVGFLPITGRAMQDPKVKMS